MSETLSLSSLTSPFLLHYRHFRSLTGHLRCSLASLQAIFITLFLAFLSNPFYPVQPLLSGEGMSRGEEARREKKREERGETEFTSFKQAVSLILLSSSRVNELVAAALPPSKRNRIEVPGQAGE